MKRRLLLFLALGFALAVSASAQSPERTVYGYSGEGRELVAY